MFNKLKEKKKKELEEIAKAYEEGKEKERERLMGLSEKELLVELIMYLKEDAGFFDDLDEDELF